MKVVNVRIEFGGHTVYSSSDETYNYDENKRWSICLKNDDGTVQASSHGYKDARGLLFHISDAFCQIAENVKKFKNGEVTIIVDPSRRTVSFFHFRKVTSLTKYPTTQELQKSWGKMDKVFPSSPDALFKAAHFLDEGVLAIYRTLNA